MVHHSRALKEKLIEGRAKLIKIHSEVKNIESQLTIGEELLHVIKQKDVRKKVILMVMILLMGFSDLIILILKAIS